MKKWNIIFVSLVFFVAISGGASVYSNWWDTNYQHRQQVTITNNADSLMEQGYTIEMPFDISGLIGDGKAQSNGSDIRVVFWDGAINVELNRLLDIDVGKIIFTIQVDIPASGSDSNYYVYYGNPSAGAAPADERTVYLFYDDFDEYLGIDDPDFLGVWQRFNNQGGSSIENGMLRMWSTTVCCDGQKWLTKENFTKNIRAKFELKYNGIQDFYRPRAIAAFLRAEHNFDKYDTALPDFYIGCCSGGSTVLWGDSYIKTGEYEYSDAFHSMELTAYGDNMSLYRDGTYIGSVGISNFDRNGAFGFYVHGDVVGADDVYFDNVRLAKYINPEPTASLGEEETKGIQATIDIDPDTLNLKSNGGWVTTYVELSGGYDVNNIVVSTVNLVTPSGDATSVDPSAPATVGDYDGDGIPDLMVKFDRATVVGYLDATDVDDDTGTDYEAVLTITGELTDGTLFEGSDTIRVMEKGK